MNDKILKLIEFGKTQGTDIVKQCLEYIAKVDTSESYGLFEEEKLLIGMLVSNGQSYIQKHLYEGKEPNDFEEELCNILDAALIKLPIEDTVDYVYRSDASPIIKPEQKNKTIEYPAYLTSSRVELSTNQEIMYKIELAGRTKARSIYKAIEIIPEYQVEFPKDTKFWVKDYCDKDGKTYIELIELPDNPLPVEKLTNNVNDFFKLIGSLVFEEAVKRGLDSHIHLKQQRCGQFINSLCTSDGKVYISPTFSQAIWNLCYAGLVISDSRIVEEEFIKNGCSFDKVYAEILNNGSNNPECEYLIALHDAYEWTDIISKGFLFLRNSFTPIDIEFMSNFPITDPLTSRVNAISDSAMGFILLHEFTHFNNEHFNRLTTEQRKDLEMDADITAFRKILAIKELSLRKTSIIGALSAALINFYMNPSLCSNDCYYREDVRLFYLFDMLGKDNRTASIFVANVLSDWFKRFHNIHIDVIREKETESVSQIREQINTIFGTTEWYNH